MPGAAPFRDSSGLRFCALVRGDVPLSIHPALRPIATTLTLLVAVVVALVLALVAIVLDLPWWPAIIIGLLVGVGVTLSMVRGSFERAIEGLGPLRENQHARLENLVEGLSLSIGVAEPDLFVLDDPALNAAVIADQDNAAVVVTSALLDHLDLMQLEGVVAELLVKIKNGDAELATTAASLVGPLVDGPLSGILSSIGAGVLSKAIPAESDMLADQAAVAITRYPPALGGALTILDAQGYRPSSATRRNSHLWLASPLASEAVIETPSLELRVDMLAEF